MENNTDNVETLSSSLQSAHIDGATGSNTESAYDNSNTDFFFTDDKIEKISKAYNDYINDSNRQEATMNGISGKMYKIRCREFGNTVLYNAIMFHTNIEYENEGSIDSSSDLSFVIKPITLVYSITYSDNVEDNRKALEYLNDCFTFNNMKVKQSEELSKLFICVNGNI